MSHIGRGNKNGYSFTNLIKRSKELILVCGKPNCNEEFNIKDAGSYSPVWEYTIEYCCKKCK